MYVTTSNYSQLSARNRLTYLCGLAATGGEAPGFTGTDGLGPETKSYNELGFNWYLASTVIHVPHNASKIGV